jgi:hypothetical protein
MKLATVSIKPDACDSLTKTEQDCVNADDNVLAARVPSPLATAFVALIIQP